MPHLQGRLGSLHSLAQRHPVSESRHWQAQHDGETAAAISERLDDIDSAAVLKVLAPIWADHYATAKQIKGNVGEVLDWAIAQGHRADNPITIVAKALPKPKEHRVPLSRQAVAVLEQAKAHSEGDSVFGGSAASLKQAVGRAMRTLAWASDQPGKAAVAHGFRSSFRNWAGEESGASYEVIEKPCAHCR